MGMQQKMFQINHDGLAKSRKMPFSVIPAEAGIQEN